MMKRRDCFEDCMGISSDSYPYTTLKRDAHNAV